MVDEPAYIKNLKSITRQAPQNVHAEALEAELYSTGSDRATVVLMGSMVEANLATLITSALRNDLNSEDRKRIVGSEGVAGTFSSKIILAYAMNLIGPKSKSDLDMVRILRNEFAHSRVPFDFRTPEVQAFCAEFKVIDMGGESLLPVGYLDRDSDLRASLDQKDAKTRFISTCHHISYRMHMKKIYAAFDVP